MRRRPVARTATLLMAVGLMAGGCGAESSVDEVSRASVDNVTGADTLADQTRPPLPPPTPEPDNDAVDAALLGMSESDAQTKAIAAGYTIRIASVDGEPRAMTMDYRFDRINLDLEAGLVTRASVG